MDERALAGLRVLDLATLFSAPLVAAMLGDLGADVVKVEPPAGDPMRTMGAARDGESLVWAYVGRNKRSVVLDPTTPEGNDLLCRLTAAADVVVVNQPQRVLERWRCTYADIAERNPRAVVVEVSGYGADGPLGGHPGNGTLAEAFGGAASMIGEPDGPPMLPSLPLGDVLSAWAGVIGAIAACYWRDARNGTGQRVDVAMYEPVLSLLGTAMLPWRPGDAPPSRTGSRVPGGVPRNCYRTRDDRYVIISGTTDAQVARILPLIGADSPDQLARYALSENRLAHGDELDAEVARWIAGHTATDVVREFERIRIPVSEVNDLADIAAHDHVRHRGSLVDVVDEHLGPIMMPAPIPRMGRTTTRIATTGPPLGAHTDEVRRDWLGSDG